MRKRAHLLALFVAAIFLFSSVLSLKKRNKVINHLKTLQSPQASGDLDGLDSEAKKCVTERINTISSTGKVCAICTACYDKMGEHPDLQCMPCEDYTFKTLNHEFVITTRCAKCGQGSQKNFLTDCGFPTPKPNEHTTTCRWALECESTPSTPLGYLCTPFENRLTEEEKRKIKEEEEAEERRKKEQIIEDDKKKEDVVVEDDKKKDDPVPVEDDKKKDDPVPVEDDKKKEDPVPVEDDKKKEDPIVDDIKVDKSCKEFTTFKKPLTNQEPYATCFQCSQTLDDNTKHSWVSCSPHAKCEIKGTQTPVNSFTRVTTETGLTEWVFDSYCTGDNYEDTTTCNWCTSCQKIQSENGDYFDCQPCFKKETTKTKTVKLPEELTFTNINNLEFCGGCKLQKEAQRFNCKSCDTQTLKKDNWCAALSFTGKVKDGKKGCSKCYVCKDGFYSCSACDSDVAKRQETVKGKINLNDK